MQTTATVLNHFFTDEIKNSQAPELLKSEEFQPLKNNISSQLKNVPLPAAFYEKMIMQINELLNIDIRVIVLGAWSKSKDLLKYLSSDNYPADEIILLPMAGHTIASTHHPVLKPSLNDMPIGDIEFNLHLEISLKGVVLKIQGGRIKEVTIESCRTRGALKCAEYTIFKKEGDFPAFTGSVNIGEGIPINESTENVDKILNENLAEDHNASGPHS